MVLPEPTGKNGKELCDILAICDPNVIIISVKDVTLKLGEDPEIDHARWERRAVDASVKQLYGAERWLTSAPQVTRSDGSLGLTLPPLSRRKTYRIAVAFGGRGEVVMKSNGFVHVMCENSFSDLLTELDTITHLVDYLAAKEGCIASGCAIVVDGSVSNLLGTFISE
jgi:hypothetical protein